MRKLLEGFKNMRTDQTLNNESVNQSVQRRS